MLAAHPNSSWEFSFSGNFPGPRLPNSGTKKQRQVEVLGPDMGSWTSGGGPLGGRPVVESRRLGTGVRKPNPQEVLHSLLALGGISLRGFWKVQGFPFSGGKPPQNFPVTQVSASLLAGGLYSADAL